MKSNDEMRKDIKRLRGALADLDTVVMRESRQLTGEELKLRTDLANAIAELEMELPANGGSITMRRSSKPVVRSSEMSSLR